LEFQQQVRESEKYISVFGLSCVQNVFPKLKKEPWEFTALEYEKKNWLPALLRGCRWGHIRAISPEHSDSMFYNYKDFFSWY